MGKPVLDLKVETFEHGHRRLWPLLGPLATGRQVIADLEGPICSGEDTTWFVARSVPGGRAIGFAALRDAGDVYWLDYAWVEPEKRGLGVFAALDAARTALLGRRIPKPVRTAVPKRRWHHYEARGFTETRRRGKWVYAEWNGPWT